MGWEAHEMNNRTGELLTFEEMTKEISDAATHGKPTDTYTILSRKDRRAEERRTLNAARKIMKKEQAHA